ncbi:Tyrosine--tRNA ligase [Sedimentisphaera cyanobacteriorum]|uniref:Tyrosine--tRNA ligase n=1 Tax=Sedimentisphaera cyanobacteriorum TaxID=1940790 RepID=A0A1Q2HLK1_9BACT|nr:tyrosine--tRNA ligase [Sedimentisphaera cyanobacteriorum]AQQ08347.1 Tyrosine--tRNA ligase [Sedimentisphaera cyanobacteriorum]
MTQDIEQSFEILKRGTVEIYSEKELKEKLIDARKKGRQLRIKLGMDPTAPDLHLGHTVVMRKLRQFQDLGHKAVLIIGDYTARIGDPTGQNTTRPVLSGEDIDKNAQTYFKQAEKILDTSEDKLEIRPNGEWLRDLDLAAIIKLCSSMTVARMLERDTFEQRYKKCEPISIHEFLYPLMQGYDSVMTESDVELGGTDQTFNNLAGRDLQRINGQAPQIVMTLPILAGLDGVEKMSKSKNNYIGVTDEPSDMYGKIMSISDEMMENYFTLLTDVPFGKIAELINSEKTHPKKAKAALAKDIISQFYDSEAAEKAEEDFEQVFARRELPDDMPEAVLDSQPIALSKMVAEAGLAASGGEAKRLVKQGGVSVNGEKMSDPSAQVQPEDGMVLKVGKRRFAKVVVK